jgi:hypothetical protein
MTNAHARPPKPKLKHHLRDADQETTARVNRNEWGDPIGGRFAGRDCVDPRLSKPPKSSGAT